VKKERSPKKNNKQLRKYILDNIGNSMEFIKKYSDDKDVAKSMKKIKLEITKTIRC
jgi:hypothetical protein